MGLQSIQFSGPRSSWCLLDIPMGTTIWVQAAAAAAGLDFAIWPFKEKLTSIPYDSGWLTNGWSRQIYSEDMKLCYKVLALMSSVYLHRHPQRASPFRWKIPAFSCHPCSCCAAYGYII